MKKHLILMASLLVSPVLVQAADRDKVEKAIEESDPVALKKFLRRICPLDVKERKSLLELAEDTLDEREAHVSIFKSRPDLTKAITGSVLSIASILGIVLGVMGANDDREREHRDGWKGFAGLSTLCAGGSIYLALKGFLCSSAKSRLALAHKVVAEIEKADTKAGTEKA